MTSPVMTMRPMRTALALIAMASLAMGLSGCFFDRGSGFAVLDRPAEARDVLPAELPDSEDLIFDPESARFVAEDDDRQLYLASDGASGICLLVYEADPVPFVGCSEGRWLGLEGRGYEYEVRADGMPASEGAIALSPNVYAVDD
jgi:hypothetical protein